MNKSKIIWLIIIVIIAVTIGWQYFNKKGSDNQTADWLTFTDEAGVYTFKYPQDFKSEYITPVDWPPQVNLLEGTEFNCVDGVGSIYARAGETRRKVIGGQEYCVTNVSEGAAGSRYDQYAYITEYNNQVVGLIFTTRLPQCANYDEPKQADCREDQVAFNPDVIASQIINSLEFIR